MILGVVGGGSSGMIRSGAPLHWGWKCVEEICLSLVGMGLIMFIPRHSIPVALSLSLSCRRTIPLLFHPTPWFTMFLSHWLAVVPITLSSKPVSSCLSPLFLGYSEVQREPANQPPGISYRTFYRWCLSHIFTAQMYMCSHSWGVGTGTGGFSSHHLSQR